MLASIVLSSTTGPDRDDEKSHHWCDKFLPIVLLGHAGIGLLIVGSF